MKHHFEFAATARKDIGKGASRRLRRQGSVPVIIYGANQPPQAVTLSHDALLHASEHESFYSSIISIRIGKTAAQEVIFKDIQRHPFKPKIVHLDFQRVQADVALHAHVPLHFTGAEKAAGVKAGGVVSHLLNDVEVTCLPKHLPEYLELDITQLTLDEALHLSDIPLPEGVSLVELQGDEPNDLPVVSIHEPRVIEEDETETPEASEVPAEHGTGSAENEASEADKA